MSEPAVLIVGAGATGLPVGYHLRLAGAELTYLVRPGRKAAVESPQRLYCYDDASLRTLDGYDVVEDAAELAGRRFDFVLITLDGHTARTEQGTSMLRGLGDVIRDTDAIVIMCAFGVGVREHHLRELGIGADRLLHGFLGMLSHQASADLPIHPPTDPARVAESAACYRHSPGKLGFRIETGNAAAAKRFAELYDSSGESRCTRMSRTMDDIFSKVAFPTYGACELMNWADFATVAKNKELWRLACDAQREILTLPQHGWLGRLMATFMGPRITEQVHRKSERDMLPLDYQAFNCFHHGGKVRAQDIESMRHCLDDGRRQGRRMTALESLLARLDAQEEAR